MSSPGRAHEIPIVHVDDFHNNIEWFYGKHAHQPVIVRGVMDDNPTIRGLDGRDVELMLRGTQLWAFDCETLKKGEFVKSETLFADMAADRARFNVVDHSILETPFADKFHPPKFLAHNWFLGSPFDTNRFVGSVNCSPRDSFSPIHVDPYGMQGWMYLIFGRKRWRLYAPEQIPLLYDMTLRQFYHRRLHDLGHFPLVELADYWEGEIEAGDLLYFPAGWPHEVVTFEPSFGFGGALVNDFQVLESARSWLWECSQSGPGEVDFPDLIRTMAEARPRLPDCAMRTALALHLIAEYRAHEPPRYAGAG